MDYVVKLWKQIAGRDFRGIVSHTLYLPFAPYPGLSISWSNDDADGWTVESVTWDSLNKMFICQAPKDLDVGELYQEMIDYYTEHGWHEEGEREEWHPPNVSTPRT